MTPNHPIKARCAFTLIELAAVLAILALAATLSIGAIGGTRGAHARHQAAGAVRDALERTRLLADGRGGAVLTLGGELSARPIDPGVRPDRIRLDLPQGWTVALADQEQGGVVDFDADGSCADVVIELRGPDGRTQRLRLLGLSGQIIEVDAGGAP